MATGENKLKAVKDWGITKPAAKVWIWLVLSLALSVAFIRDAWVSLPGIISPDWIVLQHHASPWGVLLLCLIFLWLKRKEVWQGVTRGNRAEGALSDAFIARLSRVELPIGIVLVSGAVFIPSSTDFTVFRFLLVFLGTFIVVFGKEAAKIPSILLAIYAFAIAFPLAVERFAEEPYAWTAITPLGWLMHSINFPWQNDGQWVRLISSGGEPITVAITSACAGPATMGVFMALFALMALDMPLSPLKSLGLFLFGVVGTWFQSFIRLLVLMLVGYYAGSDALWTAHFWTIYFIFPLWYLLFAYTYFRVARRSVEAARMPQVV